MDWKVLVFGITCLGIVCTANEIKDENSINATAEEMSNDSQLKFESHQESSKGRLKNNTTVKKDSYEIDGENSRQKRILPESPHQTPRYFSSPAYPVYSSTVYQPPAYTPPPPMYKPPPPPAYKPSIYAPAPPTYKPPIYTPSPPTYQPPAYIPPPSTYQPPAYTPPPPMYKPPPPPAYKPPIYAPAPPTYKPPIYTPAPPTYKPLIYTPPPPTYKPPIYTPAPPTYKPPIYTPAPPTYKPPIYTPPPPTYKPPIYTPPPPTYKPPIYTPPPPTYKPPIYTPAPPTYKPPIYTPPPPTYKPSIYTPPPPTYKPPIYTPAPPTYKPPIYTPPPPTYKPPMYTPLPPTYTPQRVYPAPLDPRSNPPPSPYSHLPAHSIPQPSLYYPPLRPRDLCPRVAESCPACAQTIHELPLDICRYPIVLKVILLSVPNVDSYSRICGKFGLVDAIGPVKVTEFRRLLRFSLNAACVNCKLTPSHQYFLITDLTVLSKDGPLYNKISMSHHTFLIAADPYTFHEVTDFLQRCLRPPHEHTTPYPIHRYTSTPIPPPPPEPSCRNNTGACPTCKSISNLNLDEIYCSNDFAFLAVVSVPDLSQSTYGYSSYTPQSCLKLPSKLLFEISKKKDPVPLSFPLSLYLPNSCNCFANKKGPVVVMLIGSGKPPTQDRTDLRKDCTIVFIPTPSTFTLPSCTLSEPIVYSKVPQPVPFQPFSTINCPDRTVSTCPTCFDFYTYNFAAQFCAAKFAVIGRIASTGPILYDDRNSSIFPDIKITVSKSYNEKNITVSGTGVSCFLGTLIVDQFLVPKESNDPYAPPTHLAYYILPVCNCPVLKANPGTKILIFSNVKPHIYQDKSIQLSEDTTIVSLPPDGNIPTCIRPPQPTTYVLDRYPSPPPHYTTPVYTPPPYTTPAYTPPPYTTPAYTPPPYTTPAYTPPPYTTPAYTPPPYTTTTRYLPTYHATQAYIKPPSIPPPYEPSQYVPSSYTPPPYTTPSYTPPPTIYTPPPSKRPVYPTSSLQPNYNVTYAFEQNIFADCPLQYETSCPLCIPVTTNYLQNFCSFNFAHLIASEVDFNKPVQNRYIIPFAQSQTSSIHIKSEGYRYILTVTNSNYGSNANLVDYNRKCIRRSSRLLYNILNAEEHLNDVDIFIPAHCQCEKPTEPSYALLLSQKYVKLDYLKTVLQLDKDYIYITLPSEVKIPVCPYGKQYKLSQYAQPFIKYSGASDGVPPSPQCEPSYSCGTCFTGGINYKKLGNSYCEAKFAVLVEVLGSTQNLNTGPTLNISATNDGYREILSLSTRKSSYYVGNIYGKACKQSFVRVLKDFKGNFNGTLVIQAESSCHSTFFDKGKGHRTLILSKSKPEVYNGGVINFRPDVTIACLDEPGQIILPECSNVQPYNTEPAPSPTYITTNLQVSLPELLPESCKTSTCPVCSKFEELNAEVYCNAFKTFFVRPLTYVNDSTSNCGLGSVVAIFDLTVNQEAKNSVLHIKYSMPQYCQCSLLRDKNAFHFLLLKQAVDIKNPLELQFSDNVHLYRVFPEKYLLPACSVNGMPYTGRTMRSNETKQIVLNGDDNYSSFLKEGGLKEFECPSSEKSCPICKGLDNDSLEDLVCSSEKVLLVVPDFSSNGSRMMPTRQNVKVVQNLTQENYGIEIWMRPYEEADQCSLPLQKGSCKTSKEKFYYDAETEQCKSFLYMGCNGNANNFETEEECESTCGRINYCNSGRLDIKKTIINGDSIKPEKSIYKYAIPTKCECDYLKQENGYAYIAYSSSSQNDLIQSIPQINSEYRIVPLLKEQENLHFNCPTTMQTISILDKSSEENTNESFSENTLKEIKDYDESIKHEDDNDSKDDDSHGSWFG